jgi:hypothetical protein
MKDDINKRKGVKIFKKINNKPKINSQTQVVTTVPNNTKNSTK